MTVNRQTILASAHRQLRESLAETGEVRPLGEIVARVAGEIRGANGAGVAAPIPGSGESDDSAPSGVIAIEKVAAFVDGHLDAAEAATICEAVMTDNSVLAEIVAAVRATQQPLDQLSPLSNTLAAQLLAMRATMDVEHAEQDAAADLPDIKLASPPAPQESRDLHQNRLPIAVIVLAVAATIVAAIVVLGRRDRGLQDGPRDQGMVVDGGPVPAVPPEDPSIVPDVEFDLPQQKPPAMESIADAQRPTVPSPDDSDRQPQGVVPDAAPSVAMAPELPTVPDDPSTEKMPQPPPDLNPLDVRDPVRIATAVPQMADVQWTEVSGLLAQRNPLSEETGSARGPTWRRVREESPSAARQNAARQNAARQNAARQNAAVALRTLPFSRAAGELGTGGRVVMSGDTALQITRGDETTSAELDLMYGSIAMVDLADGMVVQFQEDQETIATLRWQDKASAVVQRLAGGLQIQVEGGEIEINDTPVRERSVRVANQTVEPVRGLKRLPQWVTRPDDSSEAERMILAQIADTDDLSASLNRRIVALASSPALRRDDARILAKLAGWQAAMAGPGVFRLAGNRVPAVRLAALQRLAQLSESDPRYQRVWNAIDRSVNNPQRSAQMRVWLRLLRRGARPGPAQLEQMIAGLSARDSSGRALCDFLLRQYVRNPPPFDPSWTGQRLQRAINVYRERAGLPIDRVRPNAAAAGVRSQLVDL